MNLSSEEFVRAGLTGLITGVGHKVLQPQFSYDFGNTIAVAGAAAASDLAFSLATGSPCGYDYRRTAVTAASAGLAGGYLAGKQYDNWNNEVVYKEAAVSAAAGGIGCVGATFAEPLVSTTLGLGFPVGCGGGGGGSNSGGIAKVFKENFKKSKSKSGAHLPGQ